MNYDLDAKRIKIERLVKIAAVAVVGFFVSPFVLVAIKGIAGLAVALGLSWAIIQFTPYFAAVVANWRLKAIKYEASKNPIETLQNDYQRRCEALVSFRDSIKSFASEVANFHDKLEGFKVQYPRDANKFDDQYGQMKALLELRKKKYEQAKNSIAAYDIEIDRARAIWDMAQAAAAMNKAAGLGVDDFIAKIQKETAIDTVTTSLNSAFADLELSLADEKGEAPKVVNVTPVAQIALPAPSARIALDLDLDAEQVPQASPVKKSSK